VPAEGHPITVDDLLQRFGAAVRRAPDGDDGRSSPAGAAALTDVTHDSTRVRPGALYAGLPGRRVHGAQFAADAVGAGARAVLTDPTGLPEVPAGLSGRAPVLVADDVRGVLGDVAAAVHGDPSRSLAVVGLTGTNGKTTVTWLLHHLLSTAGVPAGLIGTVAVRVLDDDRPAMLTTPEATDLQRLLAEMRDAGARAVALEASSHALDQGRVRGTSMAMVGFTNLSRDHLDYHRDMDAYLEAKLRLFRDGFADRAVVCIDDAAGRRVAGVARQAGLSVWTLSSEGAPDGGSGEDPGGPAGADAHVTVRSVGTALDGRQQIVVEGPFGRDGTRRAVPADLPMPGHHNAVNAAIALTIAHRLIADGTVEPAGTEATDTDATDTEATDTEATDTDATGIATTRGAATGSAGTDGPATLLAQALAGFPGVPGRMERIVDPAAAGRTPLVVVDYAHTPDALSTALASLRAATPGRLVVVVGAGGGRDAGKRGPMGAAAAVADVVVVTDDNPRDEDPAAIRAAVLGGAVGAPDRAAGDVVEVGDRAAAIARGLASCQGPDDTVLVAGKGHETGQDYGDARPFPFDDRTVAAAALHAWAREAGLIDPLDRRDGPVGVLGVAGGSC
jgi:UDP-N-acetylmuramoyl-L-alanyl-D-glutamate--2,6-diaminopimelate ligase